MAGTAAGTAADIEADREVGTEACTGAEVGSEAAVWPLRGTRWTKLRRRWRSPGQSG